VVSHLRGLTGLRKAGHAGTLDPFADGLLPVCIGRATRVIRFMEHYDKTYRVTVAFGLATDTQDRTGQPVFAKPLSPEEKKELADTDFAIVRQAVAELTRITSQLPPMYSAVKVNGRPLYAYARKGESIKRTERPVQIHEARLETAVLHETLTAVVTIRCSKGTYIRSLCDTLGRRLGWGAHAAELRRITCGPWCVDQAIAPAALKALLAAYPDRPDRLQILADKGLLLPAETALANLPVLQIDRASAVSLVNGRIVLLRDCLAANWSFPRRIDESGQAFGKSTEPVMTKQSLGSGQPPFPGRFAVYCAGQLVAVAVSELVGEDAWRIRTERVLIDLERLYRL